VHLFSCPILGRRPPDVRLTRSFLELTQQLHFIFRRPRRVTCTSQLGHKFLLIRPTLHLPEVQQGLKLFTTEDEIWAKLDVGTQAWMEKINSPKRSETGCPNVGLDLVLENILRLARQRSIVIQSLFPLIDGEAPPAEEIEQYVQRLRELKEAGAQISLVQIHSAHRPAVHTNVGHLPLQSLFQIAQRVRQVTNLKAEVF